MSKNLFTIFRSQIVNPKKPEGLIQINLETHAHIYLRLFTVR